MDSDEIDDALQELADLVRGGSRDALARYLDLKRPQLSAFIQRSMSDLLKQKVDAADIYQETAVRALDAIESYQLGDRDPFSWLCQLAERRIVDAHRTHFATKKRAGRREQSLHRKTGSGDQDEFVNLLVNSMTTPSAAFARNQREYLLLQAVSELPETARTAIQLRYVEGRPTKEIATEIGKSDGAVRVLLTRTLRQLEDRLGEITWFADQAHRDDQDA